MKKYILGKKLGMTQIIKENGEIVPVTIVHVEPNKIIDRKEDEKNGYNALVIGSEVCDEKKSKKLNKPRKGYFKALGVSAYQVIKECRFDESVTYEVGSDLSIEIFEKNEKVHVKSKSKGKGFQGTIKRHGFTRGPMTHGSKNHRMPGSIGGGTCPGRVFKGQKMGGHMGDEWVTVKNLLIVNVDKENNLLYIKGAIPGSKNKKVEIYN